MDKEPQHIMIPDSKSIAITYEINNKLIRLLKKSGEEYFKELVKFLCEASNTNFCFVGKYDSNTKNVTTQAFYAHNKLTQNFKYNVKNTPCNKVLKGALCFYPNNVQELFSQDKDLKTLGVDSYIGLPLFDLSNNQAGLIAIMDTKPIVNEKNIKELLELVESKTDLELEKIILKESHSLSHKEYISYFQNFQDVFFWNTYDKNNTQITCVVSPSIHQVLGYTVEEYNQLDMDKMYANPDDRMALINKAKAKKSIKNYPATFKKKDGSLVFVEIDCEYLSTHSVSDAAFSLRGVIRNITGKVYAELRKEIAFKIAEKSQRRLINLNRLGKFIFETLKEVINLSNLYIAVLDEENKEIFFPYFKDQYTKRDSFRIPYNKNGFTENIINNSKIIILNTKKENEDFHKKNGIIIRGKISENLVGIPLKSDGIAVGALVVQSYKKKYNIRQDDIELIKFIAKQVAVIVDRKQWQDKLIQNEEYFLSLNENSSEIIGIINEEGTIVYINESLLKILKYYPYQLIGKNINRINAKFIDDADHYKVKKIAQLARQEEMKPLNSGVDIIKVYDKKGTPKYLELSFSKNIIRNKNKGIIFNAKDITYKIISEKKRAFTQKRLTTLHQIEKALISNNPLEKILDAALKAITENVFDVERISVGYLNQKAKTVKILALKTKYNTNITINKNDEIPFSEISSIDTLLKKKPFYVPEIKKIKQKKADKLNIQEGLQSYYISPIVINNKTIGSLNFGSKSKNYFDNIDKKLINEISILLAVVINDSILKKEIITRKYDLTNIFNHTNEGIVRIDADGHYLDANPKMVTLIGYNLKELSKLTYFDITHSQDVEASHQRMLDLKSGKTPELTFETKLIHKSGRLIVCKVTSKAIYNKQKEFEYFLSFITDITALKKASQRVDDLTKALHNSASVVFTDVDGNILDVNNDVLKNTGYTKKELIGQNPRILKSGYHPQSFYANLWDTILSGKTWKGELKNKRKDGSYYWVFSTISPIYNEDKKIVQFLAILFDITEEKNAKSNLIREVIEAQEKERERFAMEIHDGLGQTLLASKMNLNALGSAFDGLEKEDKDVFENAVKLLTESIQEARNISHGLMSRVLNKFGLAYAINEIVNNINTTQKLKFIFQNNIENQRFNEEIEMGIYRTLQELIKNIIKHSKASIAYLKISKKDNDLTIIIEDNGVGIKKQILLDPKKSGGIGLRNMKSRIEYLGGKFEIDEKLKTGARININISLQN